MFRNKLANLDYYSPDNFEYLGRFVILLNYLFAYIIIYIYIYAFFILILSKIDDKVFRNFVSWLENQKIRLYKIEERYELDNIESKEWPKAFEKVV